MSYQYDKSRYSVYFARAGDMVKIGCSKDPKRRLPQIAEWIPFEIELAAVTKGAFDLEADLHAYFADEWSHLEWFHWSPRIEQVIRQINAGEEIVIPRLPRDTGKEAAKTAKKRASHAITAAERRAGFEYQEGVRQRPPYLVEAIKSYAGSHNPPPTPKALAAVAQYVREMGEAA